MKKLLLFSVILFAFVKASAQFGPFNDIVYGDISDPLDMLPIDFDMDGDIDIVFRGPGDVFWYENLGFGDFIYPTEIGLYAWAGYGIDFDVIDFDSDGDNDVMVSYAEDAPSFLKNNGDGTFTEITIPELSDLTLFKAVDFDDDGNADIVGISDGSIVWFEGDGTGVIIDEHELESGVADELDFILADIDNDSDLDIIWTSTEAGGKVYFIENLGGGVFDDRVTTDTGMINPISVVAADIDGDLDLDVVYGSGVLPGTIHWNENMGDGTFSGSTLISEDHTGEMHVASGDIDLDGDIDLMACSGDDSKVVWYENTGAGLFEPASIMSSIVENASDVFLADLDGDGDLDGFASGIDSDRFGWFENASLNPQHVEGRLFYDENENGIMDGSETGMPWAPVNSDPDGTMAVTNLDGTYAIGFYGLPDGDYEIFPDLIYWGITTPYETYDVEVSDDFTFMDTLDFGLFPSEFVDSIGNNLTGWQFPRCLDTLPTWISTKNLGTTFPSGIIHLELADGFNYVTAEVEPDSVSGQNIYWSFETLNFYEIETFMLQVGTPLDLDSTVCSVLTTSVLEAGDVVYSVTDTLKQIVICSYDPNDKTADPTGEGPAGNIRASTEWIEYTIRFQNTGTDYAEDVLIQDQLDEDLIWTSIEPLYASHDMVFEFDPSGEVAFVFNDIMLPDSNANEVESHGFVKYRIKLKPDLAIGTVIENTAEIYFDFNPAIFTNTTINTIADLGDVSIPLIDNVITISVYPNPAADIAYVNVNMEKQIEYTIRVFSVAGQSVYVVENLSSDQTKINTSQLDKGLYILVIESSADGEQIYNTKLVVE